MVRKTESKCAIFQGCRLLKPDSAVFIFVKSSAFEKGGWEFCGGVYLFTHIAVADAGYQYEGAR